jgi:hypothetical protein
VTVFGGGSKGPGGMPRVVGGSGGCWARSGMGGNGSEVRSPLTVLPWFCGGRCDAVVVPVGVRE